MNREIQIVTVAFIDNQSHNNDWTIAPIWISRFMVNETKTHREV